MAKRFFAIITGLLLASSLLGQDTLWMSLDSCLSYAYRHNTTIQNSVLNQQAAAVSYEGAKLRFLPTLSASATQTLSLQQGSSILDGNYGVSASLPLYNGGSRLLGIQSAKITQAQSALQVEQSQNQIGSQIVSAYLTIVMNQELLLYQQELLKTAKEQQDEGKLKYDIGKILESDYGLLVANCLSVESDIEQTRITIESNQLTLRTLLGIADNQVIGIKGDYGKTEAKDILLPLQDSAVAQGIRHLPDVAISQKGVDLAQLGIKSARASQLPSIGLSAGTNYFGGKSNTVDGSGTLITQGGWSGNVGLSLLIPILNQGTYRTQYKQSKIQLQQAQLQLTQTQQETRQKVEAQYLNTKQRLNKFRSAEALAKAYKASYDVYVVKYGQGAVTTVEMLQQQDRYLSSLNDYLQSKYSFMLERRILSIYTGQ